MRKHRRPHSVNIPMMTETHNRLALELRMSAEKLIAQPSPESYNQVSKMLAALCNAGMKCDGLDLANDTMSLICDRYERVHKIGLKDCEAAALRKAIGCIDKKIPLIPLNKFRKAVAAVDVFCDAVGA